MDWDLAIKRNSEALIGIVADLFAMLGLVGEARFRGFPAPTAPCCGFCGPPKSALRRLIVVAARGLVVKPAPSRPMPRGQISERAGTHVSLPSSSSIRGNASRSCASAA